MRTRLVLAAVLGLSAAGAAVQAAASAPPTCVVVSGPQGADLQVGLAPTGPDGCLHAP